MFDHAVVSASLQSSDAVGIRRVHAVKVNSCTYHGADHSLPLKDLLEPGYVPNRKPLRARYVS